MILNLITSAKTLRLLGLWTICAPTFLLLGCGGGNQSPPGSSTTNGSFSVDLSWDAPIASSDPVVGYNVYRTLDGTNTYQLLNSSVIAPTSYVDTQVVNGTTYDYIVESVDAVGVTSIPTSPIAVTIPASVSDYLKAKKTKSTAQVQLKGGFN